MGSALFCILLITIIREGLGGFTEGAPCSERNTALLEMRYWQLPREAVECVDITSMDTKNTMVVSYAVGMATTLYADHMDLSAVPESFLALMPQLRLIDLSGNRIRRLSKDAFLPLHKLHTLLLEGNRVAIPKTTPLLNSKSLKTLMLSNNKIRVLKLKTFLQLKALTVLYLDGNYLTRVSPKIFKPLKYLKYLHLGNNRLKVIPDIVLDAPKAIVILKGNPFNVTDIIKR